MSINEGNKMKNMNFNKAVERSVVNVVDISEENRLYAMQVAAATGVNIDYICSDVLNIPNEETLGEFDIVLMEFGVLHYFTDLNSIFTVVRRRLGENGRFILTDFHPFA